MPAAKSLGCELHDEVVGVVRHGRGERTALQSESPNESNSDIASGAMTLEHDKLKNVARRISHYLAVFDFRFLMRRPRYDLIATNSTTLIFSAPLALTTKSRGAR